MAAFLKLKPTAKIEIGGHTDNVGEEQANKTLSQERANAVRKYLIETGINPQRLTTRGYGESIPVANNNTEKGKQLNRRTEVKIL